jgi:uncharacterized protein (TIGR02145 family)
MDPDTWKGNGQSGFDALPGGYRSNEPFENDSHYAYKGVNAYFWNMGSDESGSEAYATVFYDNAPLETDDFHNKDDALSVRCVKD